MRALLLGAALMISGCALTPPPLPERCLWWRAGTAWCLQGVDALPMRDLLQQIEVRRPGGRERFIAQLELRPGRLSMAALTPLGQRLFVLIDDGKTLNYQPFAAVKDRFEPAYILADLQLAHWPLATLQASLAKAKLSLTEHQGVRELRHGTTLLARVTQTAGAHWPAQIEISHPERQYTLTITTLEPSPP